MVGDPGEPAASWRFTLRPQGPGTVLEQWAQAGTSAGPAGTPRHRRERPESESRRSCSSGCGSGRPGFTANLAAIKELAEGAA